MTTDAKELARHLMNQKQCDEDGVMCIVYRQAATESASLLFSQAARIAEMEAALGQRATYSLRLFVAWLKHGEVFSSSQIRQRMERNFTRKEIYNAIEYLVGTGEIERTGYGLYRRTDKEVR